MQVFLSWSGEPSRSVAQALHGWLGVVVQHVNPWMSDQEIESGTRWNEELAASLDKSDFGLVCVTRSNQAAPWLMFEAGALAKRLNASRLVPLCIDFEPSDITSPLQSFQARRLNKDGMRRIVHELRDMAQSPKSREDIDRLFEVMWPALESQVDAAASTHVHHDGPRRSADDMLAELVTRVRSLERANEHSRSLGNGLTRMDVDRLDYAAATLMDAARRLSHLEDSALTLSLLADQPQEPRSSIQMTGSRNGGLPATDPTYLTSDVAVGDTVGHPKHGSGKVIAVSGDKNQRAQIEFSDGKRMWVVVRHFPLQHMPSDDDRTQVE